MSRIGIETIDVDEAIRDGTDWRRFFAVPDGWSHFNAEGYLLTGRHIIARLSRELPKPSTNADARK